MCQENEATNIKFRELEKTIYNLVCELTSTNN